MKDLLASKTTTLSAQQTRMASTSTSSSATLTTLLLAASGVGILAICAFAWMSRRPKCAPWRDEDHEASESLRLQGHDECWRRSKVKPSVDDNLSSMCDSRVCA